MNSATQGSDFPSFLTDNDGVSTGGFPFLKKVSVIVIYLVAASLMSVMASIAIGKSNWLPEPVVDFLTQGVSTPGTNEITGPAGPTGETGEMGPVGPTGERGKTGPVGPIGPKGAKGPQGDIGPQGDVGPQGPQGEVGPQGDVGPQGPQGDIGPQGDVGPQGPQGPTGSIGATGPVGPVGPQGAQGPQGPTGASGPTGPQGVPGVRGSYFGSFYDATTQVLDGPGVATPMKLNSTNSSNGVQVVDGYKIQVSNSGVYNIQFSAQIFHNAGTKTEALNIWLATGSGGGTPVNVPWSNTQLLFAKGEEGVAAWNFVIPLQANDFAVLYWASPNTDFVMTTIGEQASPAIPAVPSLIVTVTQVS